MSSALSFVSPARGSRAFLSSLLPLSESFSAPPAQASSSILLSGPAQPRNSPLLSSGSSSAFPRSASHSLGSALALPSAAEFSCLDVPSASPSSFSSSVSRLGAVAACLHKSRLSAKRETALSSSLRTGGLDRGAESSFPASSCHLSSPSPSPSPSSAAATRSFVPERLACAASSLSFSSCSPFARPSSLSSLVSRRGFAGLTRDSVDIQPAFARLEGFLLSNLPAELAGSPRLVESLLARAGLPQAVTSAETSVSSGALSPESSVLIQRSRLGRAVGRCLVLLPFPDAAFLTSEDRKALQTQLTTALPNGAEVAACDRNDVENYIEEFERYFHLTEDLQRLASPANLRRLVTLSPVPATYGRREVRDLLREHANVDVDLRDIVFRFRKDGVQGDACYVLCRNERDAGVILATIQETAVPNRVHYGELFGCSFLWASRSVLLLSDPQLDYLPARGPFQVFTTGWEGDVSEEEFANLAYQLRLFPKAVRKFAHPGGEDVSSFFLEFHRMRDAKLTMSRLQLLRRRWRIGANTPFFGFVRMADLRFEDDTKFADEDSAADSDLDEPIDY
ncbi:hypothetical protein BESB_083060 [Besnoitia besnoiti]|uniref:Uncharacterized protein n=1 Tax=Besnoitia besnoiti TaxID=94643 RepID=A0A2A9MBW0_BESBE|nr:hypothetical protein BESB_083060 [Besnoitia besnoiti]PFH33107.1 hypothetical protein BESB_083060 [Besnoitia besnoiti]